MPAQCTCAGPEHVLDGPRKYTHTHAPDIASLSLLCIPSPPPPTPTSVSSAAVFCRGVGGWMDGGLSEQDALKMQVKYMFPTD